MFKPLNPTLIIVDGEERSTEWLREHGDEVTEILVSGSPLDMPPCLPNARRFFIKYAHDTTSLPKLPAVETFEVRSCQNLVAIPELPNGRWVAIKGTCPSFEFSAGPSSMGNYFVGAKIRGHWRVIVGIKYFTLAEARVRWGKGTNDSTFVGVEHKREGQPEPLALTEEVFRKIVERYPEAADDDALFDPFFQHEGERVFCKASDAILGFWRVMHGQN